MVPTDTQSKILTKRQNFQIAQSKSSCNFDVSILSDIILDCWTAIGLTMNSMSIS